MGETTMRRLCSAAAEGASSMGFQMFDDVQEAVVSAVLTEMKNLTPSTIEAGAVALDAEIDRGFDSDGHGTMRPYTTIMPGAQTSVFTAMIDAILSEPSP